MCGEGSDKICIRIDKNMSALSAKMLSQAKKPANNQTIFKVHRELRRQNELAYEPQVLSVGPYHHGKANLKEMEAHKLRYLRELLERRNESSAKKYIMAMTELEGSARECYAEEISLTKDEFVEMMCVDGLFVIEFLRKLRWIDPDNTDDPVFRMDWLRKAVMRDLILFENQLPFGILKKLLDMTKTPKQEENLNRLIISPLHTMFYPDPIGVKERWNKICPEDGQAIHLLDLVYEFWCFSFAEKLSREDMDSKEEDSINSAYDAQIKCASELRQAGIQFAKADSGTSWLDITFENGVMKIPSLPFHDHSEFFLRNLIAYEEYMPKAQQRRRYVIDYATFMDLLIDFSRDVEILRHHQIITNFLGDDEAITSVINNLCNNVNPNPAEFCYSRVFREVNKHSSRRWNTWRANLLRNYFNSPWSIISFVAAVVLLSLAVIQTVFSILQYKQ